MRTASSDTPAANPTNVLRFSMDVIVADMNHNPMLKMHDTLKGMRSGGATLGGICTDDGTAIFASIDHTSVKVDGRQISARVFFHVPPGKTWEKLRAHLDIDPASDIGKHANDPLPAPIDPSKPIPPPALVTPPGPLVGIPSTGAVGSPGIVMGPPPTKPDTPDPQGT